MLKKLQNLLFEEEDDDLEEDEEEEAVEEAPVRRKHRKAAPEPEEEETISEPARPQVKPLQTATTMNRIDVTQPLPKQSEPEKNQEVFRRPAAVQKRNFGVSFLQKPGKRKSSRPDWGRDGHDTEKEHSND